MFGGGLPVDSLYIRYAIQANGRSNNPTIQTPFVRAEKSLRMMTLTNDQINNMKNGMIKISISPRLSRNAMVIVGLFGGL